MATEEIHVSSVKGIPLTVEGMERATYAGIQEGLKVAAKVIRKVEIEGDDPDYIAFRDSLAELVEKSIYQISVISMKREGGDSAS